MAEMPLNHDKTEEDLVAEVKSKRRNAEKCYRRQRRQANLEINTWRRFARVRHGGGIKVTLEVKSGGRKKRRLYRVLVEQSGVHEVEHLLAPHQITRIAA